MTKKNFIIILVILISGGISVAREKAFSLKQLKSIDIGNPALAGSTNVSGNILELTAGGADIWGTKDEFRFACIMQNGDFDLISQVESLTDPHLYTKAGLMAREDLTDNCRHIFFQVFPNNNQRNKNNGGYEFQYRMEKAGEMKAIYPAVSQGTPLFPVNYPDTWIRLKWVDNDFTGYFSTDGKNWKTYALFTLELPKKLYLGFAVTSHDPLKTAHAVFRYMPLTR